MLRIVRCSATFAVVSLALSAPVLPVAAQDKEHPKLTADEQKLAAEAARLNREAIQLYQQAKFAEAWDKSQQTLQLRRKLYPESKYPEGHPDLASSLNNLGVLLQAQGAYEKAVPYFVEALAITRKVYPDSKYPQGHADIAGTLTNLAGLLQEQGAYEQAFPYCEQALAMTRKLYPESKYPQGHFLLAINLSNLATLLSHQGAYEQALPYCEQALAMTRKLYPESKYPQGHSELAKNLNNLGALLQHQGAYDRALPYFEKALAMTRKLYPESKYAQGHADLAACLNNLGVLLEDQGKYEQALAYHEQALAMRRSLYPASNYQWGHPEIAGSLNNLGVLMQSQGAYEQALSYFEQALAMKRKLYPQSKYPLGHPELAVSLNNLGLHQASQGKDDQALLCYEQALAIHRKLVDREIATASEAQALALIASLPAIQHGYFSSAASVPNTAAASYDVVWSTKAPVMRLLARRHLAASVQRAQSPETRRQFEQLTEVRREIGRLLSNPGKDLAARDKRLAQLSDEREQLERDLLRQLPTLKRDQELAKMGPKQLIEALPPGSVFLEFERYFHKEKGKGIGYRYLAYVLSTSRAIQRIELGDANDIDRAVAQWRQEIDQRVESKAPARLHELVWEKLAVHLPAETKTLYLAPDGDLARLPWAALPVGNGRVLLEEFTLATVPHGPFLQEQLTFPTKSEGTDSLLALGGLEYGSGIWPALPGTAREIDAIQPLARGQSTTLTKSEATSKRLIETLPQARYAHLATHGFFDAATLSAEKKREQERLKRWQEGAGEESRRIAAKNPLGFTGLVLANGEVMTGLSIVDLPLENLKLVTLSACETGLGEYTGGEGVQGLQRAFHLAGCPNVVASLWKVNDAATAALMAKLYHELWTNKKPPIEALREAQLTIYHHPELIPDLAGERGAPKLKAAVEAKIPDAAPANVIAGKRADTKLWAAFVLSGLGR